MSYTQSEQTAPAARWSWWRRYTLLIVGCGVFLFFALHEFGDDSRHATCMTRRVLKIPCPTCGMTRAFSQITKGHIGRAVEYHPLSPLVFLSVFGFWLWGVVHHVRSRRIPLPRGKTFTIIAIAVACIFVVTWLFHVLIPLIH